MSKKVQYVVNKPVHGYKVGQKVTIDVDDNGVPIDRLWRRRVRDAKIDDCVALVKAEAKQSKPKAAKEDE